MPKKLICLIQFPERRSGLVDIITALARKNTPGEYKQKRKLRDSDGRILESVADILPPEDQRTFNLFIKILSNEFETGNVRTVEEATSIIYNTLKQLGYAYSPKCPSNNINQESLNINKFQLNSLLASQNENKQFENTDTSFIGLRNSYRNLLSTSRRWMNDPINSRRLAEGYGGNFQY